MYSFTTDRQLIVLGLALAGCSRRQICEHMAAIGKPLTPMGVSVMLSHARERGLIPRGYYLKPTKAVRLDPVLYSKFEREATKRGQSFERFLDTVLRHLLRDDLLRAVLDEDYQPGDAYSASSISPHGALF